MSVYLLQKKGQNQVSEFTQKSVNRGIQKSEICYSCAVLIPVNPTKLVENYTNGRCQRKEQKANINSSGKQIIEAVFRNC